MAMRRNEEFSRATMKTDGWNTGYAKIVKVIDPLVVTSQTKLLFSGTLPL